MSNIEIFYITLISFDWMLIQIPICQQRVFLHTIPSQESLYLSKFLKLQQDIRALKKKMSNNASFASCFKPYLPLG